MSRDCVILVCNDKCMTDFYGNLRKTTVVAKELPKSLWYKKMLKTGNLTIFS